MKKKTKVLSVRVPTKLMAALDELARMENEKVAKATNLDVQIPRSATVTKVIELGLEQAKENLNE